MGRRTVQLHERVKCPKPGIIALLVVVRLSKRPRLKVGSALYFKVIADLGSPLVRKVK
jgi:hypothetical protein